LCRSCYYRVRTNCYVTEYVTCGENKEPLFALKRYVDRHGNIVGKPIPVTYDVGYAQALFDTKEYVKRVWGGQKKLTPWLRNCRFRSKWLEHKAKAKAKPRGKRKLSPQLSRAFELAQSPYSDSVLVEQSRLASSYCAEKSNKVIVLKRKGGDEVIGLPYPYRFSRGRVSRLRKYFYEVVGQRIRFYRNFCFVTFTLNHTRFKTQAEAKAYAMKKWNKVLTALKRRYSRKYGDSRKRKSWISVIRTTEWQKNGKGVHLHVLVCGVRFIPEKWLKKLWGEPNPRSVHLKSLRGNWKYALNYTLKYIVKSALRSDSDEELNVSQVVNWSTLSRAYGVSRSLSEGSLGLIKHNSNSEWQFLGVVDLETYNSLGFDGLLSYFGVGLSPPRGVDPPR